MKRKSFDDRIIIVANLYNSGFSILEIASELSLSRSTIQQFVLVAKNKNLINRKQPLKTQNEQSSVELFSLKQDFSSIPQPLVLSEELVQAFINAHPDIFAENQSVDNIDISQITSIAESLNYPKSDVNTLVRIYTENNLYEEAINILYLYQEHNELSSEESQKISALKHDLRMYVVVNLMGKVPGSLIGHNNER